METIKNFLNFVEDKIYNHLLPYRHRTIEDVENDDTLSKYDKFFITFAVISGNACTNFILTSLNCSKFIWCTLSYTYDQTKILIDEYNRIIYPASHIDDNSQKDQYYIDGRKMNIEDREDKEEEILNKRCVVKQSDDGEWNATIVQKSELEQMMNEDHNILEKEKDKDI